jgi:hypothetical protein
MLPRAAARAVAMAVAEAPPGAGPGQWLGQSEASQRLGWHLERLKAAARRGRLQRRKGNAGQWLVYVPDSMLPVAAQGDATGGDSGDSRHAQGDDSGTATGAPWADLVAELRHENVGLWKELADERAARAKAEGRAEALSTALEREAADVAQLRGELTEARKPVLVRLLEALRRRN